MAALLQKVFIGVRTDFYTGTTASCFIFHLRWQKLCGKNLKLLKLPDCPLTWSMNKRSDRSFQCQTAAMPSCSCLPPHHVFISTPGTLLYSRVPLMSLSSSLCCKTTARMIWKAISQDPPSRVSQNRSKQSLFVVFTTLWLIASRCGPDLHQLQIIILGDGKNQSDHSPRSLTRLFGGFLQHKSFLRRPWTLPCLRRSG